MSTEAKSVRFRKQMAKLEASKKPDAKVKMPPRERIRIRLAAGFQFRQLLSELDVFRFGGHVLTL